MQLRAQLLDLVLAAASKLVPAESLPEVQLECPKQPEHGDFSCNIALLLAKSLKRKPRDIATELLSALPASALLTKAEVAGAGFLNLFLTPSAKLGVLTEVLRAGPLYGRRTGGDAGYVQVEFVSANPTGPLHVGHGRGAAYGASLAALLAFAGHEVEREYYVNDAGRQMDILALSTWLRYLELGGSTLAFPLKAYQGDYVRDMAGSLQAAYGDRLRHPIEVVFGGVADAPIEPEVHLDGLIANAKRLLATDYTLVHEHALRLQLDDCRADLKEFGVEFDHWFSERSLYVDGKVAAVVTKLQDAGHLYRQDGALWFRSTAFGDDKDRVVQRDNGEHTYFASDIAYHLDKFERGFDRVINIWGADHHGYIPRVMASLAALGQDPGRLTIALVQFAVLYRNGEKAQMSTRSGEFVTLRSLREDVGNDAARFFYVLRKSDQHLDFDLDLAKSQSLDNPVYYIQYAHARICSVLAQAGGAPARPASVALEALHSPRELDIAMRIAQFPDVIGTAARELSPHMLAFYLKDLAAEFHSYYNAERVLVPDVAVRDARLALLLAIRQVIRNGMGILGVSCPECM